MPTGTPGRTHGLVGTYIWGCRCEECKDASRRYYGNQRLDEYLASIEPEHGTESRYRNRGCKCNACVSAANEARYERRRRAKR